MTKIDLLKPEHTTELRIQVVVKPGPFADSIRELCKSAQIEPAAACRLLMAEAIEARRLRKAG